jgi:AAA+ superfamily predicted ATPase
MTTVVYDSPEAENAAARIYKRLSADGNRAVLMDSGRYIAESRAAQNGGKSIFIGHGPLAEKKLRRIARPEYDAHGMKYGFSGGTCVLLARKDLSFREQTEFLKYADERLRHHQGRGLVAASEYTDPDAREDDLGTAAKEFVSGMKDWYFDGDSSAAGIAIKTGLTVAFSPLIALAGAAGLVAAACQAGSAAMDRREMLETQYRLLSLEFEKHGLRRFLLGRPAGKCQGKGQRGQNGGGGADAEADAGAGVGAEAGAGAGTGAAAHSGAAASANNARPHEEAAHSGAVASANADANANAGANADAKPRKSAAILVARSHSAFAAAANAGANAGAKRPMAVPAFGELDRLAGLSGVKKTVREIVTFLQKRGKNAVPCLHMVFRGNPGTAKTTVARIMARIFAEAGITDKNLLVETDRAGLIGGYVGQTALKTEKQINKSLGGVLFIDEAYSLFASDSQDYGNEAVATLVKAMEDKRDKFACILAGYPDEMDSMIGMNPGMRDRVQFYIDFPDYTEAELMQIFEKFCADKRYELSEPARAAISAEFARLARAKSKNFSNGRLVRKVFERVCIKQAQRSDDSVIADADVAEALAEPDIAAMLKSGRAKIGFAAES